MDEKFKKRVVAITIGAVLLFVILFCVMVYGLIKILVIKKENKNYEDQVAYYLSLTEEERQKAYACELEDYIRQEARKLGYKDPLDLD